MGKDLFTPIQISPPYDNRYLSHKWYLEERRKREKLRVLDLMITPQFSKIPDFKKITYLCEYDICSYCTEFLEKYTDPKDVEKMKDFDGTDWSFYSKTKKTMCIPCDLCLYHLKFIYDLIKGKIGDQT